jgi:D-alanyl-D-alanine carboxypeptidase (penicillin-binding protein 5/6)
MITKHLYRWLFAIVASLILCAPSYAQNTEADYAVVIDMETGVTLFEKNADAPMAPASMSKLMTVLMVFEALKDGRLTLDDEFYVSDKAWREGGAKSVKRVGREFCPCDDQPRSRIGFDGLQFHQFDGSTQS